MAQHGLGAHRSHPSKLARAKLLAPWHPAIAILLGEMLPQEYDLSPWQPPRMDQGATGSCTAHGLCGAMATACSKAGAPLGFVPSPDQEYKCTRGLARAQGTMPSGGLPSLTDDGAQLADAIEAAAEFGVCPMGVQPSDGRYSDCDPSSINDEPDMAKLEQAATTLVTGAYRIDPAASTASDQIAAALMSGFPIYVGFYVDSAFENLTPEQVATSPNEADPNGGGHAVYLSGYRTNAAGKREFRLTNSWGQSWCDNGQCWVSEEWVHDTWEMWVTDVSVRAGAA